MSEAISAVTHEFRRHYDLATRALQHVDDRSYFEKPAAPLNSLAVIVKHLAGNLKGRWEGFPKLDESTRDRDAEFGLTEADTREALEARWEASWRTLFEVLGRLKCDDLKGDVVIEGERHSVLQATLRGLTHVSYHTGQILMLVRVLRPESPWLTIHPGKSRDREGGYLRHPPSNGTSPHT